MEIQLTEEELKELTNGEATLVKVFDKGFMLPVVRFSKVVTYKGKLLDAFIDWVQERYPNGDVMVIQSWGAIYAPLIFYKKKERGITPPLIALLLLV